MYHKTLLRAYLDRGEWWGHPDSLLKIINITVLNRSTCVPLQSLLSGNAPWMMKNANNDHKWTIYFRFSGFTWLPSVLVVSTWFQQFYKHLPHTYLLLMSFTKYWKSNVYSERFCLWMVAPKVSYRLKCEHHIFCLKNSFSLCCRCPIKPRSVMSTMQCWHLCSEPPTDSTDCRKFF